MQLGRWWQKILEHPAWAGIGVILATAIGVVSIVVAISGGDESTSRIPRSRSAPASETAPRDVLEQIEQSDVWVEPPEIFDSADDRLASPGDTAWSVAAVDLGNVVALTPEELVDEAVRYEGVPIYVVGRIEDLRSIPDEFGVEQELRLQTSDASRAYVGSSDIFASEGDVVFALGRVAALGQVELPSGAKGSAVYFLAVNPSSGVNFDTWDFELVRDRVGVAPSIRDAAKRATRD